MQGYNSIMQPRTLTQALKRAIKTFPAIVVTGPRQSGKTTLLKTLYEKSHRFISLENPDIRIRAKEDPLGFLEQYQPPVIIDEIQYVPELLSYVKTRIDEDRKPGQWLLTGSQNFTLMQGVSQSLAGRAAILTLLPFSFREKIGRAYENTEVISWLKNAGKNPSLTYKTSVSEFILRGCYPEITIKESVDRELWCSSYISTYLERDVRNLAHVGDLSQFERFLRLCAVRTGQILNLSEMARDIGVSVPTAKRWISVLEAGYQIFLLYPYYKNFGKRLIKSPKLYFSDTALACYLLGIHAPETLMQSSNFGHIFETMIVNDVVKRFFHSGQMPSLFYLRTRDGFEIDLVIEEAEKLHLFEIKSTATVTLHHAAAVMKFKKAFPSLIQQAGIISNTVDDFILTQGIKNYSWKSFLAG